MFSLLCLRGYSSFPDFSTLLPIIWLVFRIDRTLNSLLLTGEHMNSEKNHLDYFGNAFLLCTDRGFIFSETETTALPFKWGRNPGRFGVVMWDTRLTLVTSIKLLGVECDWRLMQAPHSDQFVNTHQTVRSIRECRCFSCTVHTFALDYSMGAILWLGIYACR